MTSKLNNKAPSQDVSLPNKSPATSFHHKSELHRKAIKFKESLHKFQKMYFRLELKSRGNISAWTESYENLISRR